MTGACDVYAVERVTDVQARLSRTFLRKDRSTTQRGLGGWPLDLHRGLPRTYDGVSNQQGPRTADRSVTSGQHDKAASQSQRWGRLRCRLCLHIHDLVKSLAAPSDKAM
jgi:hypothetical protein